MQTIESLKRNIQSAQDLLGVVKTMKALAAVSIRQYQKAVESLSEYNRTVEMGLQVVLKRSRGSFAPTRSSSAKRMGATPMVQDITTVLEDWRFKRQIETMYLYYNEYISGANYRPKTLKLLPVDKEWLKSLEKRKWESRTIPMFTEDWETLFRSLIREYLFVSLYRAFADSLASENASRLAAMQSAEKNIEERLEELFGQFHRQRQSTITEELLDIVCGFEAMGGAKQAGGRG
jgi:F-type H+-transporting ATPase subunit gamma